MGKIIDDYEYETALNNKDNKAIMDSVGRKFLNVLDVDEIHRCKLMALWLSLQEWRPNGRKFTSFLYQRVYWECLKSINKANHHKCLPLLIEQSVSPKPPFSEISDGLSSEIVSILEQKYVYKMTLREIGAKHNCCYETVRNKLKLAMTHIKKELVD